MFNTKNKRYIQHHRYTFPLYTVLVYLLGNLLYISIIHEPTLLVFSTVMITKFTRPLNAIMNSLYINVSSTWRTCAHVN